MSQDSQDIQHRMSIDGYLADGNDSTNLPLSFTILVNLSLFSMPLLVINQTLIHDEAVFYSQHGLYCTIDSSSLLEHPNLFVPMERRG